MNKKGFTLVEVIIVVALVALVMLLVIPNVAGQFGKAKKDIFYADVVNIVTMATNTYIKRASIDITTPKEFTNSSNPLDVDIDGDITYYVKVDSDGNITNIQVRNADFYYSKSGTAIKKKDVLKTDIVDYSGQEVTSVYSYVYWSVNEGGDNVNYNPSSKPSTTFSSPSSIVLQDPYPFIRTKVSGGNVTGHEACIMESGRSFCIKNDFYQSDLQTTELLLKEAMESALGSSASCGYRSGYAYCSAGHTDCNAYQSGNVSCGDGHSYCYVISNGNAYCYD